ncbi:MAG: TolC family protein [Bacteroidia bacterium]|nr:TolC family protein [Bacteroidia bacterium]
MRKRFLMSFLIIYALSLSELLAQTPLTLAECVRQGVQQNARVTQADLDAVKSSQFSREMLANAWPQIEAQAQLTDNLRVAQVLLPGEIFGQPGVFLPVQFGVQYTFNSSVQLTQILFNQSVFTGIRAARESAELGSLNAQRTREQVAYDIAALYYAVQINRVQARIVADNLAQLDELMRLAALGVQAGTGMQIDVDRVQVNRTNLLTQQANLAQAIDQQLNLLKLQMGMTLDQPLALVESFETEPWMLDLMQSPDPLQSTDIKLLERQASLNELGLKVTKQGYIPSLAGFATTSLQSQTNEFSGFGEQNNWFNATAIGLSLNIPVFDGFRRDAQIRQAEVDLLKSRSVLRETQNAYSIQFYNADKKLEVAKAALEAQKANRELAEKVYALSQLRYQQGVAPLSDVLNAETAQKEAQTNYLAALIQTQLAWLEWMKYSGNFARILEP